MAMITDTGKISAAPYVARARLGKDRVLMCPVHLSSGGSASALYLPGAGEDTWPMKGDMVSVVRVGGFIVCFGAKSPGDPALSPGEREFFSRKEDGGKAASLLLDGSGNINLNGDGKSLVTWAELNQALQSLLNTIISHTHPVSGATAGPSPGLAAASLDLSGAETKTVKTGG